MKKVKTICSIVLCSVLCFISVPQNIYAEEAPVPYESAEAISDPNAVIQAAGLITGYSLNCTGGSKKVYITAQTLGSERMASIGFKDIKVQRSADLQTWSTEVSVGDKLKSNAVAHSLTQYEVSVSGGYYYRIKLTHYAKEKALLFPDTQSVDNTSSYIWIA